MKTFRSLQNEQDKRFVSCSGKQYFDKHDAVVDKDSGRRRLVTVGKASFHDNVQAEMMRTDLHELVRRFQAGDEAAIGDAARLAYADMTKVPKTLCDAFNSISAAQTVFATIPANIRAYYSNDINTFLKAYDDGSFIKQFGDHFAVKDPSQKVKEEKKDEKA